MVLKKGRFERLNLEGGGRCFEQVKVHKSRKISWFDLKKRRFERPNLEGGNVACDRIVETILSMGTYWPVFSGKGPQKQKKQLVDF